MLQRCPDSKPERVATLPNYKLVFVGWERQWRGGVASIRPLRDEKVRGAIYEISEQCLSRLDRYEGYPHSYGRLTVTVFDGDGEPIQAITYIKAGRADETQPSAEYVSVIQQGYKDWRIV